MKGELLLAAAITALAAIVSASASGTGDHVRFDAPVCQKHQNAEQKPVGHVDLSGSGLVFDRGTGKARPADTVDTEEPAPAGNLPTVTLVPQPSSKKGIDHASNDSCP